MIYLFTGSDIEKTREKAFAWVSAARLKEPNLFYARFAREEITENTLDEISASGSLFAKRTLTLLDDPFATSKKTEEDETENEEMGADSILEEKWNLLIDSENVIVVLAPKLTAVKTKKLGTKAAKVYTFDKTLAREEVRGFNGNLVNALGVRDANKLWLEIVRALRAGDAPEMLHGLLHWKARDILEKGSRAWKPNEARTLSLNLIRLLPDSRRDGLDFSETLERFALSI